MTQLKVYDGSNQYFLDLYETEPIKLTLSIEDINNQGTRSVFSRTFRVPGTGNNNLFFKHAFLVDGVDFDVTVKKTAEILVDGAEFKVGNIRLQKIYVNRNTEKIDYEIIFLGETSDFSSTVGEKNLAQLNMQQYEHFISYDNVVQSWQAYPESLTPGAGLFDGDILYPLIDHGNTYDGTFTVSKVEYTNNASGQGFNHTQNAIMPSRFKPMIRMTALFNQVFNDNGYTYTSNFLSSDTCKNIYVSAFGNSADLVETAGSSNLLNAQLLEDYFAPIGATNTILWDNIITDPAENYTTGNGNYNVPVTGLYDVFIRVAGRFGAQRGSTSTVIVRVIKNGVTVLASQTYTTNLVNGIPYFFESTLDNTLLNAGDTIRVVVETSPLTLFMVVNFSLSWFQITQAPGLVSITTELDSEYKQIDFIKDILTRFRLVMEPDPNRPKHFIIEPWKDYIASGVTLDWSSKLDGDVDMQIEPVFYTQVATMEFKDQLDADYINLFNQQQYKETFGTLKFDANNDLLKGKRDIITNMASTPVAQIIGAPTSNFIIPQLHTQKQEQAVNLHLPIKPITRLLYYNGLKTQAVPAGQSFPSNESRWFMINDVNAAIGQNQFPQVTPHQHFPPTASSLNLNWQIERGYAGPYPGYNYLSGVSVYEDYWSGFINSLYNKYARRVTATFILNSVDLQGFRFNNIIFVNGTYYSVERIQDVEVGRLSKVKVQLIKLINYSPVEL